MVIKIVIILTEMLEIPNFGHMTTSTIEFESRNKIFVVDGMGRKYDVIKFQNTVILKKVWSSQFCWHHQSCNDIYQNNLKTNRLIKVK